MKTNNNKKGQITIFVIIGLVMLVLIGAGIYYYNQQAIEEIPEEIITRDRSPELLQVRSQIEYCLELLGEEALRQVGLNAGHLELPANMITDHFEAHANNALDFFGDTIPYAYHISSRPDCIVCRDEINLPLLEDTPFSVQSNVQRYIEQNIEQCARLDQFRNVILVEPLAEPKVQINFDDLDTKITLEWPLNFLDYSTTENTTERHYDAVLDIKFRKIYDVVEEILELIMFDNVLELYTRRIITYLAFGGEIPPMEFEYEFTFMPQIWQRSQVLEKLFFEISENMHVHQVLGSRDFDVLYEAPPALQNFYDAHLYEISGNSHLENIRIRFNYLTWWPSYLNILGGGEVIMPESDPISALGFINIPRLVYDFDYDIAAPVLIEFEDNTAFGGDKPFLFRLPVELNLKQSMPYEPVYEEEISSTGLSLSNPDQLINDIKVRVVDGYTNQLLEGIPISFTCLDRTFSIGVTQRKEDDILLETKIPECIGAELEVQSNEYIGQRISVSDADVHIIRVFEPKTMEFSLQKRMMNLTVEGLSRDELLEWVWYYGERDGEYLQGEEVTVILQYQSDSDFVTGLNVLTLSKENPTAQVQLFPGEYHLSLISQLNLSEYFDGEKDYIETEAEEVEIDTSAPWWSRDGGLTGRLRGKDGKEILDIDPIRFNDTLPLSLIVFDEENPLRIELSDVLNNEKMILPYASYNPELIMYTRQAQVIGEIGQLNRDKPELFKPRFE